MTRPILGATPAGPLEIDVERLLETRLLIQGGSGAGKSRLARRIVEQLPVQTIILDVEDEYPSLREKFPFALGGVERDFAVDPRSASLLARRLMELGLSTVLNLHDLKVPARREFTKNFLEALLSLPRSLWHDAVILIEEATTLAPQAGKEAVRTEAVVDLLTRGRKRGLCGIPVTLRISDLDKSVIAQCQNRIVGLTTLDTDVKRAAYELGFERGDARRLMTLERGQFFAYGPAISSAVVCFRAADPVTTHGERQSRRGPPPPPPEKVRAPLAKLTDLPAEAEAEARTADDLRAAERDLAQQKRLMEDAVRRQVVPDPEALTRARSEGEASGVKHAHREIARVVGQITALRQRAARQLDEARAYSKRSDEALQAIADALREPIDVPEVAYNGGAHAARAAMPKTAVVARATLLPTSPTADLRSRSGESRMLAILAQHYPRGLPVGQWAALAAMKRSGGTWSTYLSRLRTRGHVEERGGLWLATAAGVEAAGVVPEQPSTPEDVLAMWQMKPGMAPVVRIVRVLIECGGELPTAELAEHAGMTASGGTYSTYLSRGRTAGLITTSGGAVTVAETLR